jgi:hypothetical protein
MVHGICEIKLQPGNVECIIIKKSGTARFSGAQGIRLQHRKQIMTFKKITIIS